MPALTVQRWQRLLENFVLYRRTYPEDTPLRLISREFIYLSTGHGGLRIPQLDVFLQRQRVSITQQYLASVTTSTTLAWSSPVAYLISGALPLRHNLRPWDL